MGKSSLAVLLIILGAFMLFGANVFPMQIFPITAENKYYKVTIYRYAKFSENALHVSIVRSKADLDSNRWIYVWVNREAEFKRFDDETKTWIYKTFECALCGSGGTCKVYPKSENETHYTYSVTVNFDSASKSANVALTSDWEFVEWKNRGAIVVDGVRITIDLTALQDVPVAPKEYSREPPPPPEPVPEEEIPPATQEPTSDKTTVMFEGRKPSPQLQLLGVGMVVAGLVLMVTKKKG